MFVTALITMDDLESAVQTNAFFEKEGHTTALVSSVDNSVAILQETEPDIVAMSALLTITATEQKNVIEALEKSGIRNSIKVLVGGAAISEQFAETIGADGYDATAVGGVRLARNLLGV